ncbi:MAG: protein kinase [Acidobacteriota bacterium]
MNLERFKQVEAIFNAVIALPPAERESFLRESCGGDEGLRREVESLLSFDESFASVIDTPPESLAAELLATPQSAQIIGNTIGRYHILSLLGKGGMGEVYLAEDGELQRKAALKFLPTEFLNSEERLRRFVREARAASALNHPNILTIYEIGNDKGLRFIASELVNGITLREKLRSATMVFTEALEIAAQIASALDAAHAGGIVHRDIKPENLMLRRDGLVKVLDFGLAKLTEASQDISPTHLDQHEPLNSKINPSAMMGTPNYMSPEQAQGLAVDARTDIFSLGIVLYEMLAGKTPFAGETASEVIAAILQNQPTPLASLLPEVPRELERIVEKMLCKNRQDRYQTINELLIDLRDLKSELDFQIKLERSSPAQRMEDPLLKGTNAHSPMRAKENFNQEAAVTTIRRASRAAYFLEQTKRHKTLMVICLLVSAMLIGFGSSFIKRSFSNGEPTPVRAYSMPVKQTQVTTVGAVIEAKISPDGQSVAYISQEGAQYAIYLWQVAENRTLTILAPSKDELTRLDFAPDSQHIFYRQMDAIERGFFHLYRVPTAGGASEKIIALADSFISFSPDWREIAFRKEDFDNQKSQILIANADGTGERVIVERNRAEGFTYDPAWSPDGKTIVCWVNDAIPDIQEFSLVSINVADGAMSPLGSTKWRWPNPLRWMPDGKELLVNAIAHAGEWFQIFRVAFPSGDIERVTNDFYKYEGVSLTADGASLLTVQGRQETNIYVAPAQEPMNLQRLTEMSGLLYYGIAWTPDGKIVYGSNAGGRRNIWMMEADGSHLQQITKDSFANYDPIVTPDGRYIVYQCERTGRFNIWRVNIDGSNPIQLTNGDIELRPCVTPDSRWVVFEGKKNEVAYLGKVSIDGGEVQEVIPQTCNYAKVSPDGKTVACEYWLESWKPSLSIFPIDGGKPIKSFVPRPSDWQWSTDSRSLILVDHTQGFSNLFRASLINNSRTQLTNFKNDRIFAYALSRDGKKLAMLRGSVSSEVIIISNFH